MANTTIRYKVDDKLLQSANKRMDRLFAALAKRAGLTGDQIDAMFEEVDNENAEKSVKATEAGLRRVGDEAAKAAAAAKRAGDTIEKESQQGETAVEETT